MARVELTEEQKAERAAAVKEAAKKSRIELKKLNPNFDPFRARNEGEKSSAYARGMWDHVRPQFPEATEGSLHKLLAPLAGYASHGSFYAALNGQSENGKAKKITSFPTLEEVQATANAAKEAADAAAAKVASYDADKAAWEAANAAAVEKQKAKAEKEKGSALNFLSSLTPEERAAFMESFNQAQAGS